MALLIILLIQFKEKNEDFQEYSAVGRPIVNISLSGRISDNVILKERDPIRRFFPYK